MTQGCSTCINASMRSEVQRSCDPMSSCYFRVPYVRFASTCSQSLLTLSSACQATLTVKLFVPGIELQAASHNSHRYIFASAIPMPLFESQAVLQAAAVIPSRCFIFRAKIFWTDPSSAPLPSVLYFPGLMQARRLRHRHRMFRWTCWTRWSSPLSSNCFFQEGGAVPPALANRFVFSR